MGQHDRLVEAIFHRLGLGECRVDVDARDLGPGRRRIVIDPSPAGHHASDAALNVDVITEGGDIDGEGVLEVMQPNADLFGAFEGEWSQVDILPEIVAPDELDAGGAELVQADRDLEL